MGINGFTRKPGVIGENTLMIGLVDLTKKRIKKNELSPGRKILKANLPISVHITTPMR